MPKGKKKKPSGDGPERNSKGQFVKGNCGGPGGNRPNAHRRELREALEAAVTRKDIEDIMRGQIKLAPRNSQAATFVFSYLFGKPTQPVDLGGDAKLEIYVVPPNENKRRKPKQK